MIKEVTIFASYGHVKIAYDIVMASGLWAGFKGWGLD